MHGGIGGEDAQQRYRQQQWSTANAVGEGAADRQPDKVADADQQCDHQAVGGAQVQYCPAKRRCVDRNQVERGGGHGRQQAARQHGAPVVTHRAKNFASGWAMAASSEGSGFFQ
ncbi:hypothetical protein D3C80_997030 [compost metagenome]